MEGVVGMENQKKQVELLFLYIFPPSLEKCNTDMLKKTPLSLEWVSNSPNICLWGKKNKKNTENINFSKLVLPEQLLPLQLRQDCGGSGPIILGTAEWNRHEAQREEWITLAGRDT